MLGKHEDEHEKEHANDESFIGNDSFSLLYSLFRTCMPIPLPPAAGKTTLSSELKEICVIDFDTNQLRRNAGENWQKM